LLQRFDKWLETGLGRRIVCREIGNHANARYPSGLLHAYHERPSRRAAEERDELASSTSRKRW
jgi:hypothetical protein